MSSSNEIKKLINSEKSDHLQFLPSFDLESVAKSVCSLLNTKGGKILIGVNDLGNVLAVANADDLALTLSEYLSTEIVPQVPIDISVIAIEQGNVILLSVWQGSKQPYFYKSTVYVSSGSVIIKADANILNALLLNSSNDSENWERKIVLGYEFQDLDIDEIDKTIKSAAGSSSKIHDLMDRLDFLESFGLFENGYCTNAGVLLYAKSPERYLPQSRVRFSVFHSDDTIESPIEDKIIEGNIFKNIIDIENLFKKFIPIRRVKHKTEWQRDDNYLVPLIALREAVLNAISHRDYTSKANSFRISIFPTKIEIFSMGKSPVDISEFDGFHPSIPVNPDIAHILFLRRYIEMIGSGTLKIIEVCKKAGLPKPTWRTDERSVLLTFYSKESLVGAIDGTIDGTDANEVTVGAIDGAIDGTTKEVKLKLALIVDQIQLNEGLRSPDLLDVVQSSERTVERYLKILREAKLIEFKGEANHTGGYYLTNKMKNMLK